jgi:putative intracellular protease/amidase
LITQLKEITFTDLPIMHLTIFISTALTALTILTTNALTISPNTTQKPLRVGILYENTPMSDLIGLDFLGVQTPEIVDMIALTDPIYEKMKPYTTHTYANAPRDLDILVLGGPNPASVADASLAFLREASLETKFILTVCTGGMWLAKSGVLDGKKATTNRMTLANAAKLWPEVKWTDQRWVVEDGHSEGAQIWTAGGAGCGKSCAGGRRATVLTGV